MKNEQATQSHASVREHTHAREATNDDYSCMCI